MTPPPSAADNELAALKQNAASLQASIASREAVTNSTADFRKVTAQEKARLTQINERISELTAAQQSEAKPA